MFQQGYTAGFINYELMGASAVTLTDDFDFRSTDSSEILRLKQGHKLQVNYK